MKGMLNRNKREEEYTGGCIGGGDGGSEGKDSSACRISPCLLSFTRGRRKDLSKNSEEGKRSRTS